MEEETGGSGGVFRIIKSSETKQFDTTVKSQRSGLKRASPQCRDGRLTRVEPPPLALEDINSYMRAATRPSRNPSNAGDRDLWEKSALHRSLVKTRRFPTLRPVTPRHPPKRHPQAKPVESFGQWVDPDRPGVCVRRVRLVKGGLALEVWLLGD